MAMFPMLPMPAVHEEVHQRAGQEKKIGQGPEQMRPVLGEQIEQRNRGENRDL